MSTHRNDVVRLFGVYLEVLHQGTGRSGALRQVIPKGIPQGKPGLCGHLQLLAHQLGSLAYNRDAVRHILQTITEIVAVHILGDLPQLLQVFPSSTRGGTDLVHRLVKSIPQPGQETRGGRGRGSSTSSDPRKALPNGGSRLPHRVLQRIAQLRHLHQRLALDLLGGTIHIVHRFHQRLEFLLAVGR